MPYQNARRRSAERPRCQHVLHFLGLQNLRAREPSVPGPSSDDQRENHFPNAGAQKRCKSDGEQYSGKREKRVDEDDIHQPIEPSAAVACQCSNRQTHHSRANYNADANQHGDPCTKENARQNVATQLVSAHPVRGARPCKPHRKMLRCGVSVREPGACQRKEHEQQRQRDPPTCRPMTKNLTQAAHSNRTRGSTNAYTKSVSRFTKT